MIIILLSRKKRTSGFGGPDLYIFISVLFRTVNRNGRLRQTDFRTANKMQAVVFEQVQFAVAWVEALAGIQVVQCVGLAHSRLVRLSHMFRCDEAVFGIWDNIRIRRRTKDGSRVYRPYTERRYYILYRFVDR